jgi:hypothetical protein
MRSLRWGAAAAVGAAMSLAATGFGQQAHAVRSSNEACGNVSGNVGSVQWSVPIPSCTRECFIAIGPVNANYGAVGVDIAPCVEG